MPLLRLLTDSFRMNSKPSTQAGLDPVERETLDGEAANVEALDLPARCSPAEVGIRGDVGIATRRSRIDAGPTCRLSGCRRKGGGPCRVALARLHLADQAEVVGGDAKAVFCRRCPTSLIRPRLDEDRVARRGGVDRRLDGLARKDAVDGRIGGRSDRKDGDSERRAERTETHSGIHSSTLPSGPGSSLDSSGPGHAWRISHVLSPDCSRVRQGCQFLLLW